jgi:hypothetical protein
LKKYGLIEIKVIPMPCEVHPRGSHESDAFKVILGERRCLLLGESLAGQSRSAESRKEISHSTSTSSTALLLFLLSRYCESTSISPDSTLFIQRFTHRDETNDKASGLHCTAKTKNPSTRIIRSESG